MFLFSSTTPLPFFFYQKCCKIIKSGSENNTTVIIVENLSTFIIHVKISLQQLRYMVHVHTYRQFPRTIKQKLFTCKLLVSLISLPMQLQKINFKVRQHGSLKIEESVYIKNSIIFLLQSSNMEEIEHKDVYI